MVDIKLREEPVELLHAGWSQTLSSQDLVQEVGRLNFVKDTRVIHVVLVPDFVHLVADVVLLVLVDLDAV